MICPKIIDFTVITGEHNERVYYHYNNCISGNCALWNERFAMCSEAVDAYLKGVADREKEAKANYHNNRS